MCKWVIKGYEGNLSKYFKYKKLVLYGWYFEYFRDYKDEIVKGKDEGRRRGVSEIIVYCRSDSCFFDVIVISEVYCY